MKTISKKYLIVLLLPLVLVLIAYGLLAVSKSRTWQFFGGLTSHVNTEKLVVALTFDDGPGEDTDQILKTLADNDVPATFYVTGQALEKFPDQAKAIVSQGHELGNHSYSHQRLIFKSPSVIAAEITRTNSLIRDTGYTGEITFRPPNGKKLLILPWFLSRNNIRTVMWDQEPDSYFAGKAELIAADVLKNTKPGSIILLHPFCDQVCEADRVALPEIIRGLKEKGYVFVTISELLRYQK